MSSAPETRVLSRALEAAIGESRVRVAVFVSFQFDPAFFEHSILPLLFARGFSDDEAVRRAQLDEALRDLDHVSVYYDRSGLVSESGPARLDYRRIGVSTRGGVLHAKHVFLLLEDGDPPRQRLVMLTTSANLTESGWWRNVEVGHVYEVLADTKDLLREDLLGPGGLFSRLQALDRTTAAAEGRRGRDATHAGLGALRDFLKRSTEQRRHQQHGGRLHARLWHAETPLAEYLGNLAPADCCLEIISPFVDDLDDTPTLQALIDAVQPTATRILLPTDEHGRARCRRGFFEGVNALPNVRWGKLPGSFTAFGKGTADARRRYVHAKIYRIFSPKGQIERLLVGSPNLTDAAHRGTQRRGNLETAVLIDVEVRGRPDWWMELIEEDVAIEFRPEAPEDQSLATILPVTLRFDWKSGVLSYFWEQRRTNPDHFCITSGGTPVAEIQAVAFDTWTTASDDASRLRCLLRAGSFLDVQVDGLATQRVLVQETGMEDKPSILQELSPDQILEYWSMLTTEQQDAFLDREISLMVRLGGEPEGPQRAATVDPTSMFDRFAGIFHAFSCLRERLDVALARGDASGERHAIYRLFGKRHDSLGSLVDKLLADDDGDRVNRYVSLLCARQIVRWVRSQHPAFAAEHTDGLDELDSCLQAGERLKDAFDFDTPSERDRFFAWFEEMFFLPIKVPEVHA